MAKFFFNFRQGPSYQADDMGCDFATVEDAYLGAFSAAQDMWRELLIKRQDPLACAFEVMDEHGHDLFALPFSEVLDACRSGAGAPMRPAFRPHYVQEAIDHHNRARQVLDEVSVTVADARATLSETWSLLAQVGKAAGE